MESDIGVTFKREISIGSVLQILTLVVSAIVFFDRVSANQQAILEELGKDHGRVERIEKYLSSRDSKYWEIIRKLDETFPASLSSPHLEARPENLSKLFPER